MPQGARGPGFLCYGWGPSRLKEGVSAFQEKLKELDAGKTLLTGLLRDLSIQAPGDAERPSLRAESHRPIACVYASKAARGRGGLWLTPR